MGSGSLLGEMIEEALLQVHTVFPAKVISVSGDFANVQPLAMIKAKGMAAKQQAPLNHVPILKSARKIGTTTIEGREVATAKMPAPGDIVLCAACERDITETRKGKMAVPVTGHHMLSSSVLIGVL